MNNRENNQESNSTEHPSKNTDDSSKVHIQPSEPETGSAAQNEENAPGRTPGKAEGSRETIEQDLEDKENQ